MSFFERRLAEGMRDPEFRAGYLEAYAEMMCDIALNSDTVQIYQPSATQFEVTVCAPAVVAPSVQPVIMPTFSGAAVAA